MPSNKALQMKNVEAELQKLEAKFEEYKSMGLNLNMTRGKPCSEQLDLSAELNTCLAADDYLAEDGTDCRNYGGLDGIPEARRLFAELLEVPAENIMAAGNSSLNLMYDNVLRALLFALPGSDKSWSAQGQVKFICPSPGYDRHFFVTQSLGIEMIPVAMTAEGPDMDEVEKMVAADPMIKGMWSVPVYSNPDGIIYSEAVCRRLASMKTAAADFRIFLDNAYNVHYLFPEHENKIPEMISLCAEYGNENRIFEFASTSKITFAGGGMACIAASTDNLNWIRKHMSAQTIGPDKLNQLRHVRFLKNAEGVNQLMAKHADILRPKFVLVLDLLEKNLADCPECHWTRPEGGYFISVFVSKGTASEVVRLANECGVALTPAGNTYPYGKDPDNSNIRLAPSFPPLDELKLAIEVFCDCVMLATLRKLKQ
ncbi:MAG: aminotransferase class I/II-fold pyridoxal phosphate-dependent enzyme [Clostridiaceae bacterium]|nr:aminotransferase class I/II-fold pyridoxal phosphate-dependent enzyme [Clostridiaceae bacterium]